MKKLILAVGALVVVFGLVIVAGVVGYGIYLVRSINTPEFKQAVLDRASATAGTDVTIDEMNVSLLSGVTLDGVRVANPAPFEGALLTADSFVLRYRLRSLLRGRVEVERLSLEKPQLNLAMDAKGGLNYEKLAGATTTTATPATTTPSSGGTVASPIELVLRKLAVEDAGIVMRDHTDAVLMKVEDANLDTSFRVTATGPQGAGKASIGTLNLADMMFIRDVNAPIVMSKESVALDPIRGKLAGGDVTGDVKVDLAGFRFTAHLDVADVAVEKMLEESGSTAAVAGRLAAKASFEGAGGLPTITGGGNAEVADCRVKNAKALALLSAVLKVPELANPDFDQCLVEFRLANSRLHTPRMNLLGKQVQLTGKGVVNLEASTLNYDMTLALGRPLLNKITARELRGAFRDRGDGFSTVDFRIYGSTLAPQTNLAASMGRAAVTDAARRGLNRLFGRKK